ncbi:MAG TPA: nitroreductase [Gemmatimonadaceae bacterium]|nr:nitroreductase [Gemmatimonadaceae bacterium]
MDLHDAIRTRRSTKQFTARAVTREQVERLLDAAVHAPNHRMTQPWRFYVLGPESRRAYGAVLGARKAKKVEDPAAAQAVVEKVTAATVGLPAMIAVAMVLAENPEIRDEDHAATMMAVQNMLLTAQAMGLATHLKSGAIMDDARARAAVGVPDSERIVMVVELGEPAAPVDAKPRRAAAELTTWVP